MHNITIKYIFLPAIIPIIEIVGGFKLIKLWAGKTAKCLAWGNNPLRGVYFSLKLIMPLWAIKRLFGVLTKHLLISSH